MGVINWPRGQTSHWEEQREDVGQRIKRDPKKVGIRSRDKV
jgi:hypothetical protein